MELYRPMNAKEYHELEARRFQGFPPRKEEQPLFTVLLSEEDAYQIAKHMRISKGIDNRVYVVGFLVEDAYIRQFPVHRGRQALWIPADEVNILNQHLIGDIRVLASYEIDHANSEVFFA